MTGTDSVLDSIDGALRDYQVSADAMRWTPDPVAVAEEKAPEPAWFALGQIVNLDALNEFGRRLTEAFYEITRDLGMQMLPLVKLAAVIAHAADAQQRPRWHRRRCAQCNPAGFSTAPWSYGSEYNRRRKARARRRRRG